MSLSPRTEHDRSLRPTVAADVARAIGAPFSALLFWTAILTPALYLALFIGGIDSTRGLLQFLGLVALHVVALVGGHSHRA